MDIDNDDSDSRVATVGRKRRHQSEIASGYTDFDPSSLKRQKNESGDDYGRRSSKESGEISSAVGTNGEAEETQDDDVEDFEPWRATTFGFVPINQPRMVNSAHAGKRAPVRDVVDLTRGDVIDLTKDDSDPETLPNGRGLAVGSQTRVMPISRKKLVNSARSGADQKKDKLQAELQKAIAERKALTPQQYETLAELLYENGVSITDDEIGPPGLKARVQRMRREGIRLSTHMLLGRICEGWDTVADMAKEILMKSFRELLTSRPSQNPSGVATVPAQDTRSTQQVSPMHNVRETGLVKKPGDNRLPPLSLRQRKSLRVEDIVPKQLRSHVRGLMDEEAYSNPRVSNLSSAEDVLMNIIRDGRSFSRRASVFLIKWRNEHVHESEQAADATSSRDTSGTSRRSLISVKDSNDTGPVMGKVEWQWRPLPPLNELSAYRIKDIVSKQLRTYVQQMLDETPKPSSPAEIMARIARSDDPYNKRATRLLRTWHRKQLTNSESQMNNYGDEASDAEDDAAGSGYQPSNFSETGPMEESDENVPPLTVRQPGSLDIKYITGDHLRKHVQEILSGKSFNAQQNPIKVTDSSTPASVLMELANSSRPFHGQARFFINSWNQKESNDPQIRFSLPVLKRKQFTTTTSDKDDYTAPSMAPPNPIPRAVARDDCALADGQSEPTVLLELSDDAQALQFTYFGLVDPDAIVRCLSCGRYGHSDDICPARTCMYCGEVDRHVTSSCPPFVKCGHCRQRGHDTTRCTYLSKKGGGPNDPCDICGNTGHVEEECNDLGITFFPDESNTQKIPASQMIAVCYNCGSKSHWGGDCPGLPSLLRHHQGSQNIWTAEYAAKFIQGRDVGIVHHSTGYGGARNHQLAMLDDDMRD